MPNALGDIMQGNAIDHHMGGLLRLQNCLDVSMDLSGTVV